MNIFIQYAVHFLLNFITAYGAGVAAGASPTSKVVLAGAVASGLTGLGSAGMPKPGTVAIPK